MRRPLQASSGSSLFKNLSIKRLSRNILLLDRRFLSPISISSTSFALILQPVILTTSSRSFGFMNLSSVYGTSSTASPSSTSIISCSINLEFLNRLSGFFSSGGLSASYLGIGTCMEKVINVFFVTGISLIVICAMLSLHFLCTIITGCYASPVLLIKSSNENYALYSIPWGCHLPLSPSPSYLLLIPYPLTSKVTSNFVYLNLNGIFIFFIFFVCSALLLRSFSAATSCHL